MTDYDEKGYGQKALRGGKHTSQFYAVSAINRMNRIKLFLHLILPGQAHDINIVTLTFL